METRIEHKTEIHTYCLAIENDLLRIIDDELLIHFHDDKEWNFLGSHSQPAIKKFYEEYPEDDHRENIQRSLDCLNFAEPFYILRSHKKHLTEEVNLELETIKHSFEWLIDVRNRAAHAGKVMKEDQYIDTLEFVNDAVARNPKIWKDLTHQFQGSAKEKLDYFQSNITKIEEQPSSIIHNLPVPQHSETGLIGRNSIMKQIREKLLGNFPIITIVGEGGVGKTALASQIAHDLKDEEETFEQIFYCSLKTSALDRNGIRQLREDMPDMNVMYEEMGKDLKYDLSGEDRLIDALSLGRTLVIIDNLETLPDEDAISEIHKLTEVDGTKVLITSRRSIMNLGALHIPVKHLKQKDGIKLFRSLLKARQLNELSEKGQDYLNEIVEKLTPHPLTLWWVATSLEKGTPLEDILSKGIDDVISFCVGDTFDSLTDIEILIARFIQRVGKSRVFQIKTALESIDIFHEIDEIKSIIQKFKTISLLQVDYKKDQKEEYRLINSAYMYLSITSPSESENIKLTKMMNHIRQTPHSTGASRGDDFSEIKNMQYESKEQWNYSQQLRTIYDKYMAHHREDIKSIHLESMRSEINNLKDLTNHEYSEVFKISAFLESKFTKNSIQAEKDYKKAIHLTNSNDLTIKFWFAFFLFECNRYEESFEMVVPVHEKNDSHPAVMRLYALIIFELNHVDESIDVLRKAIDNFDEDAFTGRIKSQLLQSFMGKALKFRLNHRTTNSSPNPIILEEVINDLKYISNPRFKNRWDKSSIGQFSFNCRHALLQSGILNNTMDFDYSGILEALDQFPGKIIDRNSAGIKSVAREFGFNDALELLEKISPYPKSYFGTIFYINSINGNIRDGFISFRREKDDENPEKCRFKIQNFRPDDREKVIERAMVKFTLSDYIPEAGDVCHVDRIEIVTPRKKN